MKPKTKPAKFNLYTYDLWGNDEDGYTVNDVYYQGVVTIPARLDPQTGTYHVTDRQINRAIGARGLTWDGDEETVLYATDKRGNPVCELRRIA